MQRWTGSDSGIITAADTSQHTFASDTAGVAYFRAGASNTGTVTIGAPGTAGGIPLAAGEWSPPIGPMNNLNQLAYTFSVGTDTLNFLLLR